VQSIVTLVCHLQQAGLKPGTEKSLKEFIEFFLGELSKQIELGQNATDPDFLVFQRTVNANVKSGARTRQMILLRKLFRKHPVFFSALSQSAEISKGLTADCATLANTIRDLITASNERYAALNGSDLFKPTNKTATALNAIGSPVTSLDEYKTFIENLYFIFREGVGQRLDGQLPISFVHVKDLRTMLQHDVDHGKAEKVAAKRKHLAAIFSTYSGVPSPDAVDPSQFSLVQANILGTLSTDLSTLAKSLL